MLFRNFSIVILLLLVAVIIVSSRDILAQTNTTLITPTTTTVETTTSSTAPSSNYNYGPNHTEVYPELELKILPLIVNGGEIRRGECVVHLLLRRAQWIPPVGSWIGMHPLNLDIAEVPVTAVSLNDDINNNNNIPGASTTTPTPTLETTYNKTWLPYEYIYANISVWAEPVNQEDEQQVIVQTALMERRMNCYIIIVSVSEGNLICNGTVYPAESEKMNFVIPPFLIQSLQDPIVVTTSASSSSSSSSSTTILPDMTTFSRIFQHITPRNVPFTATVFIGPEEFVFQTVRRVATSILALIALVAIVVGKEPHIHIMSVARMSLIGRVLECSDEVDFILHPTHIKLGRGIEKGRYFGCLIFNTAITMGLVVGHNLIARIAPRLVPDPPPATQFVVAGALLPGIALAGLKTITLQSSPVQFFLAVVVILLFVGAWVGCYVVTSRDKDFFQRFGRWQHKTDPFFMLRWRVFFTSYKAKNRWYVIAEIFFTLFMAIPSGVTLTEWLTREESCRYRSIAMISLVGLDFVVLMAARPYAIKIDKIVYAVAKLFELGLSAAAVARTHHQVFALEIGTLIWILGVGFVAGFQAWRAYSKAQYNSQQNEFFLTTADTADTTFHDLGDDDERTQRLLLTGGRNGDDDDDGYGDEEGSGGGSPRSLKIGKEAQLPSSSKRAKTTLAALFPESDYRDDEDDENYDNYAIMDETSAAAELLAPAVARASSHASTSRSRNPVSNNNVNAPGAAIVDDGFVMISSPHLNENKSSSSPPQPTNKRQQVSSAWKGMMDLDYEVEMAEYERVQASAPRLQICSRVTDAPSIPNTIESVSLPEDPLIEFWDALSETNTRNNSNTKSPTKEFYSPSSSMNYNNNNRGSVAESDDEISAGSGRKLLQQTLQQQQQQPTTSSKLALRGISKPVKMTEAQPCRLQVSDVEVPSLDGQVENGFLPPKFVGEQHQKVIAKAKEGQIAEDGVGYDML